MTLRLVQAGSGDRRQLVALFLVGAQCDEDLREALGPTACIVADDTSSGTQTMRDVEAWARSHIGGADVGDVTLVGYSAGCQRVRQMLIDGAEPHAVVVVDGTHASWPAQPWQIDVWRELADEARRRERVFVASCTHQTYTEKLPKGQAFTATVHVLEHATGLDLEAGGPIAAPIEHHDGELHVYSYASHTADADAHVAQQRIAMPWMLARHVGVGGAEEPAPPTSRTEPPVSESAPPTSRCPPSGRLGERALALAVRELGIRETPGPKATARISEYLAGCERSGKKLGLASDEIPWCAAFASWCGFTAAKDGEDKPTHGYRAAVAELWADAAKLGCAEYPPKEIRVRVGDLAIWKRGTGDPRTGGTGHVGRVESPPDASGRFVCIEGNHDNQVARVEHRVDEPDLVGFIAYP